MTGYWNRVVERIDRSWPPPFRVVNPAGIALLVRELAGESWRGRDIAWIQDPGDFPTDCQVWEAGASMIERVRRAARESLIGAGLAEEHFDELRSVLDHRRMSRMLGAQMPRGFPTLLKGEACHTMTFAYYGCAMMQAADEYGLHVPEVVELAHTLSQLALAFAFRENTLHVLAPPREIRYDERGRTHSELGAAIRFERSHFYFWRGIRVSQETILDPGSLTFEGITAEPNVEVRRAMIDRITPLRFFQISGAEEIDRSVYGVLYRKEVPGLEPLVYVKVTNATPEADGSFREYWLRAHPRVRTAREAVAASFGLAEEDYRPQIES